MKRRTELFLVTLLLLIAVGLRTWDLTRLPPGLNDNELAHIRIAEAVRQGEVAIHYQVGDGQGRTVMFGTGSMVATTLFGDGLFGYRVFPVLGSLITLALLYSVARRLFGPELALVALAAMAVNLRAVLLARSATAETFVMPYVLITLWMLALVFHLRHEIRFHTPVTLLLSLLAVLLGASGYLHYSTLALGPLTAAFYLHLLLTKQPISRRSWNSMIFVTVLSTVVAVPYLASTLRDFNTSEPYILWEARPHSLADAINGVLHAISGLVWRGDPRPDHNLPDLPLLNPGTALLLVAGIIEAGRRWREPRCALLLIGLAAGLLTDAWVYTDATFSAHLVALPAVFMLVGLGVMAVWRVLRVQWGKQAAPLVTGAMVALLALNVVVLRDRLFNDWPYRSDVSQTYHTNLGHLAYYLDHSVGDLPVSLCGARINQPNTVGLSNRQILRLMMHRHDIALHQSDCRGGMVFVNAGAPMRFVFLDLDDRTFMPPELQEWLEDAEPIPVENLPTGTVLRLDVEQRLRDSGGYWDAMATARFMPDEGGKARPAKLPVRFEGQLTFAGYDPRVFETPRQPGDPVVLVTYWRVDGPLPPDLGIFAQILAHPNPMLAPLAETNTMDVLPTELTYRDLFAQVSYIWLSEDLLPGNYPLTVGAYTGSVAIIENHLGVLDEARGSARRGERLLLGNIQVTAPPPEEPSETPDTGE